MASEPRGSAIVPPPELRRQMLPPGCPSAASDEAFSYVPHVAIAVSAVTEASTAQEKPMLDGKSDRPPAAGRADGCALAAAFDPEAVVLYGGLVNAGDLLVGPARRAFEQNAMQAHRGKLRILVSSLNNGEAAVLGAGCLVRDLLAGVEVT